MQLTAGESDYGAVTVGVPGVGLFAPGAAVQVTATSPTSVQFAYSGAALLDTAATLDTELVLGTRGSGQSSSVSIQLTATLDLERHTGSAQLSYNGQQYIFLFAEPPYNADVALQQVVTSLNQQDAGLLYSLADRRLRGAVSLSQFTTGFNAEFQALGTTMNAQILVNPAYTNERWGYRTATGVIMLTNSRWSAVSFVYDEGAWKFKTFFPVPVEQLAVVAGGPYAVTPGQSVALAATALNPAGGTLAFAWDLDGNGSYETIGQNPTFSAAGIAAPASRTVGVRVTSGGGGSATGQTTVTIAAPVAHPPQIVAQAAPPVAEGGTAQLTVDFTDADTGDTHTCTIEWGDGATSAGTITAPSGATPGRCAAAHLYADNQSGNTPYAASVTVVETGGAALSASASVPIVVTNAAPSATFTAPDNVTVGAGYALSLTAPLDVAADLPTLQCAFDCGDGAGYGAFAAATTKNCTAPLGSAGTRVVKGKVRDKDDGGGEYTANVAIGKITPTVTWATPAPITYGTALGAAQLNASTTVAGTFAYTPASGTILAAGPRTLSVTITPTDTANYSASTATVTLTVNQATPTITWGNPAAIANGTALGGTQLNATASVAGSFVYTPPAGTLLATGTHTLSVAFTPTDGANYTTATKSVTLTVTNGPVAPNITWADPANIGYGTALSAAQLNATAAVPGTFSYSPAAGTVLHVGNRTLTVTFTPTNATQYSTATASVTVRVTRRQLWVIPKPQSRSTNQPNPGCSSLNDMQLYTPTPAGTGLVNGDTFAGVVTLTQGFSCTYGVPGGTTANPTATGTYNISGGGLLSSNYDIRHKIGTLTVTPSAAVPGPALALGRDGSMLLATAGFPLAPVVGALVSWRRRHRGMTAR